MMYTQLDYLNSHTSYPLTHKTAGFVKIVKNLHAFKCVLNPADCDYAVVNLIIPEHATIFVDQESLFQLNQRVGAWSKRGFDNLQWRDNNQPSYEQLTYAKLRADFAFVHSMVMRKSLRPIYWARALHDKDFIYRPDHMVSPKDRPFDQRPLTCSSGIHFFLTLAEARDYHG